MAKLADLMPGTRTGDARSPSTPSRLTSSSITACLPTIARQVWAEAQLGWRASIGPRRL
jgi:hypothetical protein